MAEWPSGTVTFLFTDLEGSTQRWQQYPAAMGPALGRHDRLVREAIAAHGGVVFKTVGDAVCAAFATAPAAVAAALTAQRALYTEPWGATGPLRARMALHTGQAEAQAGDYLGGPLNRVARLLAGGHGGQILLSGPTADLVQDYLPPGVTLRDLGTHRLKDVHRPEHVFQLVAPDLPADFAPLATLGPIPARPDPASTPPVAGNTGPVRRPAALAAAVLAAALLGALAAYWAGSGGADRRADPPAAAVAATDLPAVPSPPPTTTATGTAPAGPPSVPGSPAVAVAAVPPPRTPVAAPAASPVVEAGGAAGGPGQVVYSVDLGHVFRVAARAGAAPEDLTRALDALAPPVGAPVAPDDWVNLSPDGAWLLLGTERFDPECAGWPCLALVRADLSAGEAVRVGGAVVHPAGPGAVAADGNLIVYPGDAGPHELDLWAVSRQDDGWAAPVLLTGASRNRYHDQPAVSADGTRVAFDCGDRPYAAAGTALCEVGTDGAGFRVVLAPADAPPGRPAGGALHRPAYAPDGGIVFEAAWTVDAIWRLPPGAAVPEPVAPAFTNDNAPCALADGRIASLWLERPGGRSLPELKVMASDGSAHAMLVTGVDIEAIGCGG